MTPLPLFSKAFPLSILTCFSVHARADVNSAVPQNMGGFDALLEFVLPSPHQENAGSCLYMATTGVAEWWLAKLHPHLSRRSNGPVDLSERYLMNVGAGPNGEGSLKNWLTDSILLFNKNNSVAALNTEYRYTKGWHLEGNDFNSPASADTPYAVYGTGVNWISRLDELKPATIGMPVFRREVIFADLDKNPWNVGIAPRGTWQKVRNTLATRKAPVLVIYNHKMVWHTVFIVGFNDTANNGNCAFTKDSQQFLNSETQRLAKELRNAKTRETRDAAKSKLQNTSEAQQKLKNALAQGDGCSSSRGVFYVRDSWENNPGGPVYNYDTSVRGEEKPYSKAIVTREYDWLDRFASSVVLITASYPR